MCLQVYPKIEIVEQKIMSLTANCLLTDCINRHSDLISKAELAVDMRSKWNRSRTSSSNHKRRNRKSDDCPSKGRKKVDEIKSNNPEQPTTDGSENLVQGVSVVDSGLPLCSRLPTIHDLPKNETTTSPKKIVRFNDDHLVDIFEFPYTQDEKDVRQKYWEIFAIDRQRFKDRINQLEDVLGPVLVPKHREQIYSQRFLPSSLSSSSSSSSS